MGMQPILPITVTVKKIKGAARQCYGGGVVQCEQTLTHLTDEWLLFITVPVCGTISQSGIAGLN